MKVRFWPPFAVFVSLAVVLGVGLQLNPREVPSPLIGKPAPPFSATLLTDPARQVKRDDLLGKVWILNVWASWCAPCREEHPVLVDFARRGVAPVYGLNYKDKREDAIEWLRRLGDPYTASLVDPDGRIAIDWGVYGVPETFVVDRSGTIRYKHVGVLTPEVLRTRIEPLVSKL